MPGGRPPKPTPLKELQGNPGKRALNKNEPKPPPGAPRCPPWLPAAAKAEWRRVVKILEPLGLVTQADQQTLAAYCLAVAELRTATKTLAAEGRTVRVGGFLLTKDDGKQEHVGGQVQPHPAISQQRSAWAAIKTYSALFGLDPSSRGKLSAPPKDEPDAFENWMKGGAKIDN